ncbi:MAG: hypothetical protein AB7S26_38035 [Sandaracinaceae bacterium]
MREARQWRLWRARELLGSAVVGTWAAFHLWEQWSAFGGRAAWTARMLSTSQRGVHVAIEVILGVLPIVLWLALELRLWLTDDEPAELRGAMAEDDEVARRLGLIVRVGSRVFFLWLLYHVAWLWLPKLLGDGDPVYTWLRLRLELGTSARVAVLAVGLTAFFLHAWGSFPRALIALGFDRDAPTRRAARLSGAILATGFLVLYAELAGWHIAGAGTVWPLG